MERRDILTGLAASALIGATSADAAPATNTILELRFWHLHNSREDQPKRVADYLEHGFASGLDAGGGKLEGAFSNLVGDGGPYYVTLAQFPNFGALGEVITKLRSQSSDVPFVRVESSILRSFDVMPNVASASKSDTGKARVFEMRTYESPNFAALTRKVKMFNDAEAKIFERLGMRPVFFGETVIGPRIPNLTYMLSYDSLGMRDQMWQSFGSDPEWKKLSAIPELKDSEIVSNISNVMLRPLRFSAIQ